MGRWCLHASWFIFYRIIIKVADNQDRHKSLVGPNQTTHFGVICPWVMKMSHFWTWISLKPVGQSWSNFMCSIIGVGEGCIMFWGRLGKDQIWPWHIGLRWVIVALWATCFSYLPEEMAWSLSESWSLWSGSRLRSTGTLWGWDTNGGLTMPTA